MKCKACNGTGVLVAPIYENDEIGFVDKTYQCYCCRGSGVIEQTNEEWFNTLTTKGKAETIAYLSSYGGNVEAILDWLKDKHNG